MNTVDPLVVVVNRLSANGPKWLNVLANSDMNLRRISSECIWHRWDCLARIFPSYESSHNDLLIKACLCTLCSFKHRIKFPFGKTIAENWHRSHIRDFSPRVSARTQLISIACTHTHTKRGERKKDSYSAITCHITLHIKCKPSILWYYTVVHSIKPRR